MNKKRKKVHGSGITESQPSKIPILTNMEVAMNSGEADRIRKFFLENSQIDNIIFQTDMSIFSKSIDVPIFREFKGVNTITSYLVAMAQAIPDNIHLYTQRMLKSHSDGKKEIHGELHMIGRRLYEILVIEDKSVHDERSRLESAIAGLTSLASGNIKNDEKSDSEDISIDAKLQSFTLPSASSTQEIKLLDEMNILVAHGNVEFKRGNKLEQAYNSNQKFSFVFHLDSDNKIYRMRFIAISITS